MKAEIITIGDEILIGQITDTNSGWLGQQLSALGIQVVHRASVSDQKTHIKQALTDAAARAQVVLITGGLGPTKDDVTKHALAEHFNSQLTVNPRVLEWVTSIFTSRRLPMLEENKNQALVPDTCEVLFNRNGTAPGMWFDKDGVVYISMPGVPYEMKTIFQEEVTAKLKARFNLPVIIHRTLQTIGIGESFLAKKIEAWEDALPDHIKLAYLPAVGAVRLRMSAYGTDEKKLAGELQERIDHLMQLAGEYIYAEGEVSIQEAVGKLLAAKQQTLCTAESCTGGYIAHLLTSVPGSSEYYMGSVLAYANYVKTQELGISKDVLEKHGAVSEVTVTLMAENARKKLNTTYAIATSGIAGPGGGSIEKPVGTVWIALATPGDTFVKMYQMGDHRERTIQRTALTALDLLRRSLSGLPLDK